MAKQPTLKTHEIVDGVKVPISKETLARIAADDKKELDRINDLKKRANAKPAAVETKTASTSTATPTTKGTNK